MPKPAPQLINSMPQPGTQLNGKRSKRGRLSEGRPTKKTPEMVARNSETVSLGLTDEETSALVDIEPKAGKPVLAVVGTVRDPGRGCGPVV